MVVTTYIAFFDLLGYSTFVENNDMNVVTRRVGNILADLEFALSLRKANEPFGGIVTADRSNSHVNCINISDSIIFWVDQATPQAFEEIIQVCYELNWKMTTGNFPIRGALTYGELGVTKWDEQTTQAVYRGNVLYGKGLISAHKIASSMQWSGSMIDNTVFESYVYDNEKIISFIENYAVRYRIPYNYGTKEFDEFAFMLSKPNFNEIALENGIKHINRVFSSDKKDISSDSVQMKIKNTIEFYKFLKSYKL